MAQLALDGFSESQTNLYLEQFCPQADAVYRLGMFLTLSASGAEKLTTQTFKLLVEEFDRASKGVNPLQLLMAFAWQAYLKIKNETFKEEGGPLTKALRSLGMEHRAVLYAIDVLGLEENDVAKIFGTDTFKVRQLLAQGRQGILKAGI